MGAEGSGSKLAALAAAQTLEAAAFRSPSFPPPYDPSCAESRGVWKTWDGHGIHANFCAASAVIHRSLPHANCFPDIRSLVRELKDDYKFDEVLVVVAARDPSAHTTDEGEAPPAEWWSGGARAAARLRGVAGVGA